MAGTSPRRSIRSRPLTQQNSNSHHSSASSNSSSRGDRNTRTSAKAESPRKLTSNESLSSEPLDDRVASSIEESLSTRRRKRGQTDEQDKELKDKRSDMPNGISEPVGEDDEAVRCICGSEDYPGPPQITDEDKKGIKEVVEPDLITPEDYTEDLAGFFLQCDMCKVWQHGGCVGIKNEDMSPDEYFCELCRSDLHKVFTASNGQKYSHYLPLYQHQHQQQHQQTLSRSTSRASRAASFSKDGTRSPRAGSKNGRPTSSSMMSANQKRRSTMNSRDAAYDEEEQLRRAIEASKGEKSESTDGGGTRRKRGRSDSEEKQDFKRQRTLSNSPSPQKEGPVPFGPSNDSDDAETTRPVGAKKIRGAAARNHREKEAREEREKTRLEAANKRKGRAERRRIEDLEPPEDLQPPTTTTPSTTAPPTLPPTDDNTPNPAPLASIPPSSPPQPKTTPSTTTTTAPAPSTTTAPAPPTSHKKGGRPPHTRKGKVGKNQYTRDRDLHHPHDDGASGSPRRSESREGGGGGGSGGGGGGGRGGEEGRRGGGGGRGKTSLLEMRRRVAGMLEFISRTQVEMAESGDTAGEVERVVRALGGVVGVEFGPTAAAGAAGGEGGGGNGGGEGRADDDDDRPREFGELSLLGMMDALTGELVKWQKAFT